MSVRPLPVLIQAVNLYWCLACCGFLTNSGTIHVVRLFA